ncbi:centromere-associated E, partial [Micractinium conductrix]
GSGINIGLLYLGICIKELAEKGSTLSYRNSTLTEILKPALGGGANELTRFLQQAGTVKNLVRADVQMLRQQELQAQDKVERLLTAAEGCDDRDCAAAGISGGSGGAHAQEDRRATVACVHRSAGAEHEAAAAGAVQAALANKQRKVAHAVLLDPRASIVMEQQQQQHDDLIKAVPAPSGTPATGAAAQQAAATPRASPLPDASALEQLQVKVDRQAAGSEEQQQGQKVPAGVEEPQQQDGWVEEEQQQDGWVEEQQGDAVRGCYDGLEPDTWRSEETWPIIAEDPGLPYCLLCGGSACGAGNTDELLYCDACSICGFCTGCVWRFTGGDLQAAANERWECPLCRPAPKLCLAHIDPAEGQEEEEEEGRVRRRCESGRVQPSVLFYEAQH